MEMLMDYELLAYQLGWEMASVKEMAMEKELLVVSLGFR